MYWSFYQENKKLANQFPPKLQILIPPGITLNKKFHRTISRGKYSATKNNNAVWKLWHLNCGKLKNAKLNWGEFFHRNIIF